MHWAAAADHSEVAEVLLAGGAEVDVADNYGNTPLHFAARSGSKEVAALLVDEKIKDVRPL